MSVSISSSDSKMIQAECLRRLAFALLWSSVHGFVCAFVFLLLSVTIWRSCFQKDGIVTLLVEISAQWNTL